MKLLRTVLSVLLSFYFIQPIAACSCARHFFCDYIANDNIETVVVKGEVIQHRDYGGNNRAIYLKVLTVLRDDVEITSTIKLFGNAYEASCDINIFAKFPLWSTVYVAFNTKFNGYDIGGVVNDPDDLVEDHWKHRPNLCHTNILKLEGGWVKGFIADGVEAYSTAFFEESLKNCEFTQDYYSETPDTPKEKIVVFPNPSGTGRVRIDASFPITKVNLYEMSGRLLSTKQEDQLTDNAFKINQRGIFILEIFGGQSRCYEKVVVQY